MKNPFKIVVGPHAPQLAIQSSDLTLEECQLVRRIVTNQWSDSDDYKLKQRCQAFLQGYEEPRPNRTDGWVLVEFWSNNLSAMEAFTAHVNREIADLAIVEASSVE